MALQERSGGRAVLSRALLLRLCDSLRRCLVKRPPAAVYTAEDGTEQTVPWVVAPGPPGTIVTRPDGIKVKVPEGVQRGQLFSLAEAAPAGEGAVAPKHAAEPPSLTERTALLARKAWIIKSARPPRWPSKYSSRSSASASCGYCTTPGKRTG